MNTSIRLGGRPASRGRLLVFSAALLAAPPVGAQVFDLTVTGVKYHAQVNDHYCASATIQMMLDCTAVRTTNPYINQFLLAPDPAPSAALIPAQPIYAGGQVLFAPQVAIYNLIHGQATYTPIAGPNTGIPLSYNNPLSPWPTAGSGTNAVQWALNVLDNPLVGGNGNHTYTAYNVPPTLAWGDYASRTIANAIKDYDVPAQVAIGSGAHSIAVTGVTGTGVAGRNNNYTITGFYVNDPWTGYAASQGLPDRQRGLGEHTWVRYGYREKNGAPQVNVPGIGLVNAAPNAWFRYFNPAPPQPGEGAYLSGWGYKFVVEPLGPELLDDGNGGLITSILPPDPLLGVPLTAATVGSAAFSELTASDFNDVYGLSGGGFGLSDFTLLDPGDDNVWLVPYKRGSDYTGALLINAETGEIEQATWIESGGTPFLLEDLVGMYSGLYIDDFVPQDNFIPEPGAVSLTLAGFCLLLLRRRRRA